MTFSLKLPARLSGIRSDRMFSHIFKYEFKSCLRQKAILFWLIAFPIILGCFFKMAFSGIYEKDVVFNAIPVAVTNIEENDILKQVLEQIQMVMTLFSR